MIRSKTYKIILLLTTFIMAMVAAVCSFASVGVKADNTENTIDKDSALGCFSGVDSLEFSGGALVATVKNGDELKFDNELMINDFKMGITIGAGITKVTLKLVTDAYYINGNVVDDKLVKDVTSEFVVTGTTEVAISVGDGINDAGKLTVNGQMKEKQVKPVGMVGAKLSFVFEGEGTFKINYVNQKAEAGNDASTNKYIQTFAVAEDKLTPALPRVALGDEVYSRSTPVFKVNASKTLSFKVYSVLGGVNANDVYIGNTASDDVVLNKGDDTPTWIAFRTAGEKNIVLVYKDGETVVDLESIKVNVVDGNDTNPPEYKTYNDVIDAVEAFKFALKQAYTKDGKSIYLGATLEIPSMEDLVSDAVLPYSDLKTTVYYRTPTTSSTSSNMSFKIDKAGTYSFFVVFSDGKNEMKEEDFMKVDGNDVTYGKYWDDVEEKGYIFSFDIADDATMSIETTSAKVDAYRGVSCTVSNIKVEGEGFKTEYALYYNSKADATVTDVDDFTKEGSDWVKIPKASSVTDEDYDKDGYDYDAIKTINYNGKLTFTPNKFGSYAIVCNASSEYTTRTAESFSVIRVTADPAKVKVPSTWLKDNVWSVVFLSVGTLCLAGIIVLLCIKPKDEKVEEN